MEIIKPRKVSDVHQDVRQTFEHIQQACLKSQAQRVLILKSKNGGGVPHVGKKLNIAVLYEHIQNAKIPSVKANYKYFQVDLPYVEMLSKMYANGFYDYVTDQEPDSHLNRQYRSIGIQRTRLYYLYQTKEEFYYVAFSSMSADDMMDATSLSTFEVCVSNLRNIFKNSI